MKGFHYLGSFRPSIIVFAIVQCFLIYSCNLDTCDNGTRRKMIVPYSNRSEARILRYWAMGRILDIDYSNDGKLFAYSVARNSSDGSNDMAYFFDSTELKEVYRSKECARTISLGGNELWACVAMPNESSPRDGDRIVWGVLGREAHVINICSPLHRACVFSPISSSSNGRWLSVGTGDGDLFLWQSENSKPFRVELIPSASRPWKYRFGAFADAMRIVGNILVVAYIPDGTFVYEIMQNKTTFIPTPCSLVHSVAISRDGYVAYLCTNRIVIQSTVTKTNIRSIPLSTSIGMSKIDRMDICKSVDCIVIGGSRGKISFFEIGNDVRRHQYRIVGEQSVDKGEYDTTTVVRLHPNKKDFLASYGNTLKLYRYNEESKRHSPLPSTRISSQ